MFICLDAHILTGMRMVEAILFIGLLALLAMVQTTTTKQLEKMKRLERMILHHDESGLSIAEFCRREGIHESKFHYWKQRFQKQGGPGLIDQRRGKAFKVMKSRRNFIVHYKLKNPLSSSRDIAEKFENRFRMKITSRRVSQILRKEGLNDPVGRKTGKPVKKTRK